MIDWNSILTSYLGGLTGGFAFMFASWCASTGNSWTDKMFRKGMPKTEKQEYTRKMGGRVGNVWPTTPNAMFWASSSPRTALFARELWLTWYLSASDSHPITTMSEPSCEMDIACTGKILCSGERSNEPSEIVTTNSSSCCDFASLRTDNSTRNSSECNPTAPALFSLEIG